MGDSKKCLVDGCNEPRFRKCTRCHAHQKEEWKRAKDNEREKGTMWQPKTPEQRDARLQYLREYQENRAKNQTDEEKALAKERLRLSREAKRGTCDVEGCQSPRFGKRTVCRAHHQELKKAGATIVIAQKPTEFLADFPRLLAVDTKTGKYVQYAPVRVITATSERSLRGTRRLLSERPNWIVAIMEDDNG